ncbi:MAG: hypothetical protein R3246_17355, partial [Acidimicrobiia bacterium]|nr:hypothetical protein [Acidimicrobiia bacterium]
MSLRAALRDLPVIAIGGAAVLLLALGLGRVLLDSAQTAGVPVPLPVYTIEWSSDASQGEVEIAAGTPAVPQVPVPIDVNDD